MLRPYIIAAIVMALGFPASAAPGNASHTDAWSKLDQLIKPGQDPAARKAQLVKAARTSAVVPANIKIEANIDDSNVATLEIDSCSADLDCKLRSLKIGKEVFKSDLAIRQLNCNWKAQGSEKSIHLQRSDVSRIDKGDDPVKVAESLEIHSQSAGGAKPATTETPGSGTDLALAAELSPGDTNMLDALKTRCEEAIRRDPTSPANHVGLGKAFQLAGDFDQAEAEFKQALFFDKNYQPAREALDKLSGARKNKQSNTEPTTSRLSDKSVDYEPYLRDLNRRLKRHWLPPQGHANDRVDMQFKIARDGSMSQLTLKHSCHHDLSDTAALKSVENAAPFRPLPEGSPSEIAVVAYMREATVDTEIEGLETPTPERKPLKELMDKTKNGTDLSSNCDNAATRIKESWHSQGTPAQPAAVSFNVLKNGNVEDVSIYEPSGDSSFDNSAKAAVESIKQLDKLPSDINGIKEKLWVWAIFDGKGKDVLVGIPKDVDFSPYMEKLQKKIRSRWFPPKGEKSREAVVVFKVDRQGKISDVKITTHSGVAEVDKAATEAVAAASPLAPLPQGAPNSVDIQFKFDYNVLKGQHANRTRF